MENKKKKARWYGPKQIGIMIFTAVCFLVAASVVGGNNNTVFPAIAEARGWNVNILNVFSGIAAMLEGVGVLVFSRIIKKVGPRIMIGAALIVTAVLMVIFGSTTNITIFIIVVLLAGFLGAIYDKAGNMILTANWWPTKKGVVLGFTTIGVCCMNLVYVPLMPKLFASIGISRAFLVVAAILAVLGVICFIFVRSMPEEAGEFPDGDPNYATGEGAEIARMMKEYKSPFTVGKLLKMKDVWFLGISAFLAYMAALSFIASTIPNLIGMGYSPAFGTAIFAVGGIVSFPGSAIFGVIDQKIGTKKAWIIFLCCMIVGYLCTLGMAKVAFLAWAAGVIIFMSNAALCNLVPSYIATKFGRWDYAAASQVINTLFTLGAGTGIMITGLFHNPTVMYIFDIVVLAIALVLSIFTNDAMIGKKD